MKAWNISKDDESLLHASARKYMTNSLLDTYLPFLFRGQTHSKGLQKQWLLFHCLPDKVKSSMIIDGTEFPCLGMTLTTFDQIGDLRSDGQTDWTQYRDVGTNLKVTPALDLLDYTRTYSQNKIVSRRDPCPFSSTRCPPDLWLPRQHLHPLTEKEIRLPQIMWWLRKLWLRYPQL